MKARKELVIALLQYVCYFGSFALVGYHGEQCLYGTSIQNEHVRMPEP